MHSRAHTTAIILAAGRGLRMGGPKALLRVGGEPLVLLHARRLAAVASEVVVVLSPAVDASAATWPAGVRTVLSDAPDPSGSLAIGVAAGSAVAELLVIALVDALPVRAHTLATLLAAMTPALDAATPTYRGTGGHPVVVRRSVLAGNADDGTLRDRLAALGDRRARIACDGDPAVVSSLNTPRDVQALRARGLDVAFAAP